MEYKEKMVALSYLLAALAVSSCIIRNDYNVVFSFLLLGVLNKYYDDGKSYYSKIVFQILAGLCIVDLLWLTITVPYWSSDSKTHHNYWASLKFVHWFAVFLAVLQIGLKGFMAFLTLNEYKSLGEGEIKDLWSFNYDSVPKN